VKEEDDSGVVVVVVVEFPCGGRVASKGDEADDVGDDDAGVVMIERDI